MGGYGRYHAGEQHQYFVLGLGRKVANKIEKFRIIDIVTKILFVVTVLFFVLLALFARLRPGQVPLGRTLKLGREERPIVESGY